MFTEVLTVCIGFQRTLCILEILVEAEQPVGFLALDHSENGLFTAYWSMGATCRMSFHPLCSKYTTKRLKHNIKCLHHLDTAKCLDVIKLNDFPIM